MCSAWLGFTLRRPKLNLIQAPHSNHRQGGGRACCRLPSVSKIGMRSSSPLRWVRGPKIEWAKILASSSRLQTRSSFQEPFCPRKEPNYVMKQPDVYSLLFWSLYTQRKGYNQALKKYTNCSTISRIERLPHTILQRNDRTLLCALCCAWGCLRAQDQPRLCELRSARPGGGG